MGTLFHVATPQTCLAKRIDRGKKVGKLRIQATMLRIGSQHEKQYDKLDVFKFRLQPQTKIGG
jgi:hypothetical protein